MVKLLFLYMVSGSCLCCLFVTPSSHHTWTEQMISDPKNFQSSVGHDTINRLGNNAAILVHASSPTISKALFYFFFPKTTWQSNVLRSLLEENQFPLHMIIYLHSNSVECMGLPSRQHRNVCFKIEQADDERVRA